MAWGSYELHTYTHTHTSFLKRQTDAKCHWHDKLITKCRVLNDKLFLCILVNRILIFWLGESYPKFLVWASHPGGHFGHAPFGYHFGAWLGDIVRIPFRLWLLLILCFTSYYSFRSSVSETKGRRTVMRFFIKRIVGRGSAPTPPLPVGLKASEMSAFGPPYLLTMVSNHC
jgi:hypothetical protein